MSRNLSEIGYDRGQRQIPKRAQLAGQIFATMLAIPGIMALNACGDDSSPALPSSTGTERTIDPTITSSPVESLAPFPLTNTPEATIETSTSTEVPEFDCKILEQRYCAQGNVAEFATSDGTQFKLITFDLPENVPIFAPFDGSFTYSDGPGNLIDPNAPAAVVYKPVEPNDQSNLTFMVTGDIEFNKDQLTIRKGDIIAQTKSTGIKILGKTIAILVTSYDIDSMKITTDNKLTHELFPELFD